MAVNNVNKVNDVNDVVDHKCLLYWHQRNLHSIPAGDKRLSIFPGYNAFDYSLLPTILKECEYLIDNKLITFWGIDIKPDGSFTEARALNKIDMKSLTKILNETYNEDTIAVLSNPDIVPAAYARYASERSVQLKSATGTESDNIEVHEVRKGI